jgi:hypothetical protein
MAKHRRRSFNAKDHREDVLGLAQDNPELLADTSTRLARRAHNQAIELESADESTKELLAFMGTLLVMPLMGAWAGRMDAERDELLAQWEAEGAGLVATTLVEHPAPWDHQMGASDPTKWWIFPKLAVIPIGFAIASAISHSLRRPGQEPSGFERFTTLTAMTSTTYFLARSVAQWARARTEKKFADRTLVVSSVRPTVAA